MEQTLQQLAENSLLGLLFVLSLFIIRFLYYENKALQTKYEQAMKETRDSLVEPLSAIKQTLNTILFTIEQQEKGGRKK